MYHLRKIKVLLAICMLACASSWAQDTKISLANASATATSDQGGNEGASSVIDGDYSKFWHSQWYWGAVFDSKPSVDLTIALSEITLVDYVRYIPRQGSNQGHWGEVEVFYSPSTTGTSFISVGTFDLGKADMPHDFFLNGTNGVNCGQIKFTIRSGSNNHATAAEIEMYQLDKVKLNAFAQCFSDDVYSELKPGVASNSIADADVRTLVESMQSNPTGYKKFRVGEYKAYETLGTLQQRLKTKAQYSRYENPTGVYFTAGQSYFVAVSGIGDDAVGLRVKNWYLSESTSTYPLRNGLNYITATTEGNVFVSYYTDDYAEAPTVKVHFINAPVIGYWNQDMSNDDWVALLADKGADDHRIIITQSEHAQLAFPISAWKNHCPTDVETLMEHYQNVQWAIRDMMGLDKYGYQTRNRQIFYATDYGFMAAGGEGAYCNYGSLGGIMNASSFDFWGVAHEWGHNNQISPGFHWSGCGETTNNIYASLAQYRFTANRDASGHPTTLRLEDETSGIDEYSGMRGGRMQTYFEEAVRKGVAWQLQDGPDYHGATPGEKTVTGRDADGNDLGQVTTTSRNYDHFVKLVPFWQLNLWGNLANKCPDIITDVIHSIRTAENYTATYNTNGKQQINWMKLACDHAEIDLLPFFEKAGMLRPIHAYIEDYDAGWNIITEEMIDELKDYVKQKGYPAYTEEINYINAHNMHIYRANLKLNVTGLQGEPNGDKLIVQHSVAQNAVAFETYNAQDELIRITMYGLGSNDEHSFTQVLFPSDAAYVMAVGYDGERQIVYKESTADVQYVDFTISSNVTGGGVIYNEGNYTTTLNAPSTLAAGDLTAITLDGYVAQGITVEGTTITVTYNKIYTIQVTGGGGNGGVTYNGNDYAHNATITVLQDIDEAQLEAKVVDGYNAGVITVNHDTKVITVTYTMTPLVDTEKYYTLRCWDGSQHGGRFICDDGTVINGHSTEGTLFQFEAANDENGYYIKSYVSDKYLNVEDQKVVAGTEKTTVWTMATSSHTTGAMILSFNNKYLNNNGAENNSCPYLQLKAHGVEPENGSYCSLWKLTEGTPLDKSALNTLIGETNTLIESCYTDEEFDYAGSLNVTEELVTATREAVTVAQEKYDSKATTESEYEAALNALQTAKDNLQTAINYAELPVQLTFDANSPVTYKIKIARANTPVLAYVASNAMVAVTNFVLGNKAHVWYFMAAADGQVYIMPYYENNTTLALSTNDFSVGAGKVKAVAIGTEEYTQGWTITNVNMNEDNRKAGWYNITTINPNDTKTTWYFSNYYGVNYKMGFYNDPNDNGSRFQFEQADFSKSEAYYTLYNYYHNDVKLATGSIEGSAAVGYFSEDVAAPYNEAYNNATAVLANTTAEDEDYISAHEALKKANEALVLNMPEVGKYYMIRSAHTGYAANKLIYATGDNTIRWDLDKTEENPEAVWTFTSEGYLENLNTGCAMNTGSAEAKLGDNPKTMSIKGISTDGQVLITPAGGTPLHADQWGHAVSWGAYDAGSASAWRIVEVEDMSLVNFTLKIGQYRHAGLYLNYAAEIPEGVEVYIAHTPDGEAGSIFADKLEGTVLPARTAVIIKGDEGEYSFKYTTDENTIDAERIAANLLGGSAYLKYQQVAKGGNLCCVFGQKGGEVGLYKNWVGYADVNGTAADTNGDKKVNEDGGTHFKVSANKIYYEYEPSAVAGASAFRFRFNNKEEGTTTIDELIFGGDSIIYNLYGQRIVKVAEPGIYIVNGKKIYVSDKMILNND